MSKLRKHPRKKYQWEHKIGSKIHYKGETYVVHKEIDESSCYGCDFPRKYICGYVACVGEYRSDKNNVIFKKWHS